MLRDSGPDKWVMEVLPRCHGISDYMTSIATFLNKNRNHCAKDNSKWSTFLMSQITLYCIKLGSISGGPRQNSRCVGSERQRYKWLCAEELADSGFQGAKVLSECKFWIGKFFILSRKGQFRYSSVYCMS